MIREKVKEILSQIPQNIILLAATKGRSVEEIEEAIEGGIKFIGENYVQEAEKKFLKIGRRVKWHMIGHLQTNKVKKAIEIFDMIETVDSIKLAKEIDKEAKKRNIIYPVLIEINSGKEHQKTGVFPEDAENLIYEISKYENIKIEGLMTMGPVVEKPEDIRPYFKLTKELFEKFKRLNLPNVEMKYLSMGMTDTWRIAIEEGANIIRIGTGIFGPRRGG
ncbi:MAG: YggS family pyridoxal phosphate-dependent enzyme [Candidatus Omnitrophica bacterium]|nr:YggS family pyridoxal phosphate-dependent enzyme [Candidatus Omnitrophota bacterium]MCM8807959.1 YggS family pyridoxal phosphate-dependent enzyme [Candidatus Omnitrophota bacterium]